MKLKMNENNENESGNWYDEKLKSAVEGDGIPEIKKYLKEKFKDSKAPFIEVNFTFLDEGKIIQVPDKYNNNEGKDITKRIFNLKYDGKEFVMFVSKSPTDSSLYGQILSHAKTHGGITNVLLEIIITGKLGDKSMRYIVKSSRKLTPEMVNSEKVISE